MRIVTIFRRSNDDESHRDERVRLLGGALLDLALMKYLKNGNPTDDELRPTIDLLRETEFGEAIGDITTDELLALHKKRRAERFGDRPTLEV